MKTISKLCAGVLIVMLAACSNQAQKDHEMVEKNKEAVKKVNAAFETGNTEGLENYIADNCVEHTPDPMIKSTGPQYVKDAVAMMRTAYPDAKMEVIAITAEGDMVTCHFKMKGTNTGPYGTMPATNKAVDVSGVDIVRFENGKAVEHWGYWEEGKMMAQLGLIPDMSKMAETQPATPTETPVEKK